MAKNKNETAQEKIARLQAEMAAAQKEVEAEQTAKNEATATNVRKLTKMFGVPTLADVISLIKQVEKGTLGKLDASASRAYVRLTDEQKTEIKARLAKGGSGNQVSELAAEFNVSGGTIYNLKKEKVGVPAPATPEVVTSEVAPVAAS